MTATAVWGYLDQPPPVAIAHRGGSLEAPENTMRAFSHAVSLGYRHVGLDVRATIDREVIVFRDPTLERVAGQRGAINEWWWREVREARVDGTELIPRLDEVLDTWPDLRIAIEVPDDAVVEPLVRLLRLRDAWDRVCLGSPSGPRLARLRALSEGHARTAIGHGSVLGLRLASFGLPLRPPGDVAQVPVPAVDRRLVRYCHRVGLHLHAREANDRKQMVRLLDLGVDGLFTDRPTLLRDLLVERGHWEAGIREPAAL